MKWDPQLRYPSLVSRTWEIALALGLLLALMFLPGILYRLFADPIYGLDERSTKAAIHEVIPVGSSIEFAKSTMEMKGFRCRMMYNEKFADEGVVQPAANFLYCDSGQRAFGIITSIRWQVAFVAKDGLVSSVGVGVGTTSL